MGTALLALSWGCLFPAVQARLDTLSALTLPPMLGLGSSGSFLWYFVACLNCRDRLCMAVNKRESASDFCRNPAERNRISCKRRRDEQHGLLYWRKRWREQRPDDPVPTLKAELWRRLRLPRDLDLPRPDLDLDDGLLGLPPVEASSLAGVGFSLAITTPATFFGSLLMRLI